MRVKIDGVWVAGHPGFDGLDWTGCQGAVWSPSRMGGWTEGAGHERVAFEDGGVPGFSLSFGVTRVFRSVRGVAEFLTRLHGRVPPHPWCGAAVVVFDAEDGGSVELDCGVCVLQLAAPAHSIEMSGLLTVVLSYMLHGGVVGEQPTYVPPVNPALPGGVPLDESLEEADYFDP